MKVIRTNIDGMMLNALVVNKDDPSKPCENCGKPCYDHPRLAKKDFDWCVNCNDEKFLEGKNYRDLALWTLAQDSKGLITVVVTEAP